MIYQNSNSFRVIVVIVLVLVTLSLLYGLLITGKDLFEPLPTFTPAPTMAVMAITEETPTPAFTVVIPATWTPQPIVKAVDFTRQPSSTAITSPTNAVITLRAIMTRSVQKANANRPYLALTFSDEHSEYVGFTWLHMTGKVHNTGTLAVYLLEIRVTILDKHGQQINNRSFLFDSEWLYPGTSSTFSVDINDPYHATKSVKTDYANFFYKDANGQFVSGP